MSEARQRPRPRRRFDRRGGKDGCLRAARECRVSGSALLWLGGGRGFPSSDERQIVLVRILHDQAWIAHPRDDLLKLGISVASRSGAERHLGLGQRGSDERRGISLNLLHRIALRGWLALTTIAGRGRASSPAPEGHHFSPGFARACRNSLRGVRPGSARGSTPPLPLGRAQTGRDAAPTVLNPSVSRGPNRLHVRVLPGRGGVGALLAPASHPGRRSRSCPPRSAARFAGAA